MSALLNGFLLELACVAEYEPNIVVEPDGGRPPVPIEGIREARPEGATWGFSGGREGWAGGLLLGLAVDMQTALAQFAGVRCLIYAATGHVVVGLPYARPIESEQAASAVAHRLATLLNGSTAPGAYWPRNVEVHISSGASVDPFRLLSIDSLETTGWSPELHSVCRRMFASAEFAQPHIEPNPLASIPPVAYRGVLGRFVYLHRGNTEAAESALLVAGAAALGIAVGRSCTLRWGPDELPPLLFVAIVGTTAKARKSTAIAAAAKLIVEAVDQDGLSVARGSGSGEGFAACIADAGSKTGRRCLFVIDELAALLKKISRKQAGNMEDFIIDCFDAAPRRTHQTRNKPLAMTNALGAFLAASTMEWLGSAMTETQVYNGLANRFLWIGSEPGKLLHRRPEMDPESIAAFLDELHRVLDAVKGNHFLLTAEAEELHRATYVATRKGDLSDPLLDAAMGRADQHALRLAMVFAVSDGTDIIRRVHIEIGWSIVWHSAHTLRQLLASVQVENRKQLEGRVVAAIRRHVAVRTNDFSIRDIHQRLKGGRSSLSTQDVNQALYQLELAELIERIDPNAERPRFRLVGD